VTATADEEDARVTAGPLPGQPGWVAVVAVSLETYDATQSQVQRGLAIGGGAFIAIAGLGAYWLARAALSPVERLRRQAAAISERDEDAALEVPQTKDEIAALAGTMNDLLSRLRRALQRERAFVADASHELRSPPSSGCDARRPPSPSATTTPRWRSRRRKTRSPPWPGP